MSTKTDPNPTEPEEVIRRDMADAIAAIIYSALPVEGDRMNHFPVLT
jgi:hypothetical protein